MFLVYPVGHDQAIYTRPWFTWSVVGLCVAVFVWMQAAAGSASEELMVAAIELDQARQTQPSAGITQAQADTAPPILRAELQSLVDEEAPVSDALDAAVDHLVSAARGLPLLRLGYVPAEKRISRAFTSMFAHGGWMHLLGNLFLLLIVGSILEGYWRLPAYVALYVGAGLAGVVVHHLVNPDSPAALVGASGCIAGCIAALLVGFARTRITMGWLLWLFAYVRAGTFQMPVWVAAPVWGGLQILALVQDHQDGVAYGAHVGGFVFGLVFALVADRLGLIARDGGQI